MNNNAHLMSATMYSQNSGVAHSAQLFINFMRTGKIYFDLILTFDIFVRDCAGQ